MNDDSSRIIAPGQGIDRIVTKQDRRSSLKEINKLLVHEIESRNDSIRRQAKNIQAMNQVFTQLAQKLGTPIPGAAIDGPACLRKMVERIEELLETEKKLTPDLK